MHACAAQLEQGLSMAATVQKHPEAKFPGFVTCMYHPLTLPHSNRGKFQAEYGMTPTCARVLVLTTMALSQMAAAAVASLVWCSNVLRRFGVHTQVGGSSLIRSPVFPSPLYFCFSACALSCTLR